MAKGDGLGQLATLFRLGAVGDLSDAQLVRWFLTSDRDDEQAAFAQLVGRHGPMILRICRQVLRDPHEAQDAFQATFMVLARKAGSVQNADSIASWLHGVAFRVAAKSRVASARRRRHERQAALVRAPALDAGTDQAESWPELHEEIARLPERYREPVVLCYLEGLTIDSAALRLGCSRGTIGSRLSRARDRLRSRLERRGLGPPSASFVAAAGLPNPAGSLPQSLLAGTVRAGLGFASRRPTSLPVSSASASTLAQGVIYAMMLNKLKVLGAASIAVALSVGGLDALGRPGPASAQAQGKSATGRDPKGDPSDLNSSLGKIQADLKAAARENARVEEALRSTQAHLESIRADLVSKEAGKEAAARLVAALHEDPARAVDRLAEAFRRHPVPRTSTATHKHQLYIMDLIGGGTTLIADEPAPGLDNLGSAKWSRDGRRIVFDASPATQYQRARMKLIEVREGRPTLTDLGPGVCPNFSPDGTQIAFTLNPGAEPGSEPGLWIMRADGSERRHVADDLGSPYWSPTGHEFLLNGFFEPTVSRVFRLDTVTSAAIALPEGAVFGWPTWIDPETVVAPVRSTEGVESLALLDIRDPGRSVIREVLWKRSAELDVKPLWPVYRPESRRCYFVGVEPDKRMLLAVDRGHPERVTLLEGRGFNDKMGGLSFSPDGRFLLYSADRPASDPTGKTVGAGGP